MPPPLPLDAVGTLPPPDGDLGDASGTAQRYLQTAWSELRARHDAGAGGIAVVASYTHAMDQLVCYLHDSAQLWYRQRNPRISTRCTVIAQGGYGRGELNPRSDVDVLMLYPWKLNPYVETLADVIVRTLYDAGLAVGNALRNTRECMRLAADDLKVKTSLLDARHLCGDDEALIQFKGAMRDALARSNRAAFFKQKLAESAERHARAGHSIYLLQPNLKEGKGGLRDLHTALWLAKIKFNVQTFRDLIAINELSGMDVDALEDAVDFLWRVRNACHFATGDHQDVLTFELQEQLAPALGFGEGRDGVERFMRTYYAQAATAWRVSELVIACCQPEPRRFRWSRPPVRQIREHMRIQEGELSVAGASAFEDDPSLLVAVFRESQRHQVPLSTQTRTWVREAAPRLAGVRGDRAVTEVFREILRAREPVADVLFDMHSLGVLTQVLPEFGNVEFLIAHDPVHIYTVDHHSLTGVREIDRLRLGTFERESPLLTQVVRELAAPELLVLGMMFHDVGKGHGHDHSSRGARLMREAAQRLGLNEDEQAACEFLVQHHLLMSHMAQYRDVHDQKLVVGFCKTVGSLENLERLYVLTYADMRAVGPGAWTSWRGQLLGELYCLAREYFERGVFVPEDASARAERIRRRLVSGASAETRAVVERFAETMPDRYFLSTPEELMPEHAEMRARLDRHEATGEGLAVITEQVAFRERGFSEITVCTRDRPGLFAMLSGAFATHRMNILAARVATSTDGVALDAFRISLEGSDADLERDRWGRAAATLHRVLAGDVSLDELVASLQRPSLLDRKPRRPGLVVVTIDQEASADFTVIDVFTADRVGVLFTIARCLFELGVNIHVAKITTRVDQVLDVFYVTDKQGGRIVDQARLEEIREALVLALSPSPVPVPEQQGAVGI
jgi:[protein-PII] uridylyltransferase